MTAQQARTGAHRPSGRPTGTRHRHQCGFTLIEVLVAALVLSIGLLGLAALQGVSIKTNHTAYVRSQASGLAYEIADAMRANRDAAVAGAYNLAFGSTPSGSSLADTDLQRWRATLQAALPGGTGAVAVSGTTATVTIRWDSSRDPDSSATMDLVFETRL